ncbi:MAG: D-glycero-beta-D-manno-heptose 1,7-bisphosphate 7-phosphatase [Gammaproteobacteria bacterium]|nr:D-glycero-beta-D-manno-heptose 1,7-bisphosphate 7-phosphatase [Gammaproteobacteria bacterium]
MKLIVLDRDGVINEDSDAFVKSPQEWHLLPGSGEAIAKLNRAGFTVVVATNQSGVARGLYDWITLEAIHEKMRQALKKFSAHIDEIYICPHHPDDNCACRKPKSGLLEQIGADYSIDWADVYFIGDTRGDVEAAWTIGCRPLLLRSGKGERVLRQWPQLAQQVKVFDNLRQAVEEVLLQGGSDE